jgi:two-component system alkaline phosphatase synthesis response regulator PhoP
MSVKTILVVDDEESIRTLVSAVLASEADYRVHLAVDGEDGLAKARALKPDLMFLDVRMPKMDGHEVCRLLKEDPATQGTTIVIFTAFAQHATMEASYKSGADAYMTKPFRPKELREKAREMLGAPA